MERCVHGAGQAVLGSVGAVVVLLWLGVLTACWMVRVFGGCFYVQINLFQNRSMSEVQNLEYKVYSAIPG